MCVCVRARQPNCDYFTPIELHSHELKDILWIIINVSINGNVTIDINAISLMEKRNLINNIIWNVY